MRRGLIPCHRSFQIDRRAFTLIEVLVTITIIGLLVAIVVPAVQYARESARRSRCSNNLRQMGIALQSYGSAMGCLPNGLNGQQFSLHAMLLPYLDQKVLYNSINMHGTSQMGMNTANGTIIRTTVEVFLCDSDTFPLVNGPGTNYSGSLGYEVRPRDGNGYFIHPQNQAVSLNVPDGSAHTVAITEVLKGVNTRPIKGDRRRQVFTTASLTKPAQADLFATTCREVTLETGVVSPGYGRGRNWLEGQLGETLYNHVLNPNANTCMNGSEPPYSAWTASSDHPGGVNSLFGDGHVHWIKSSINNSVWRALGTRNGGEIVSESSF